MRHAARCIAAYARHSFASLAGYRVSTALYYCSSLLSALILLAVWTSVARARGGSLGGYATHQLVTYFLVATLVNILVTTDLPTHISANVRSGKLSSYLLRPAHALTYYIGHDLNYRGVGLPIMVPVLVVLHAQFSGSAWPGATSWIWFAVVVSAAYVTRVIVEGIVACAALRFVRAEGTFRAVSLISLFLGGQFVPIAILPGPLPGIARALPFYWSFGLPVEIATGTASHHDAAVGLLVLLGWVVVLTMVFNIAWRRGVRAHEAVGQ